MSDNLYYIPEELSSIFRKITLEYSDHHETFKHWWNRVVDAIRQDDFATETKRLFSGLAESKVLADDLEQLTASHLQRIRQKKEAFIEKITEKSEGDVPYSELSDIWKESFPIEEAISRSLELLRKHKPEDTDESFSNEEMLYHKVASMQKEFKRVKKMYAKYLGLARCRNFYWEQEQLCYFDEARSNVSIVDWGRIQNCSIKELLNKGHQENHATYIRFRYFKDEQNLDMHESYEAVRNELESLRPEVTYGLPDSIRSLNKTAKKHVDKLLQKQSR